MEFENEPEIVNGIESVKYEDTEKWIEFINKSESENTMDLVKIKELVKLKEFENPALHVNGWLNESKFEEVK